MQFKSRIRWLMAHQSGFMYATGFVWAAFYPAFHQRTPLFIGGLFTLVGLAAALAVVDGVRVGLLRSKAKLDEFGKILAWAPPVLSPMSSMFQCVEEKSGVKPSAITELRIQTCELGHRYVGRFKHLMDEYNVHPKRMEVVGVGNDAEVRAVYKLFPEGKVFRAKSRLVSHFNLARAGDVTLIWYEPEHSVCTPHTYAPQDGAFLVRVEEGKEAAAIARFDRDKAELVPV